MIPENRRERCISYIALLRERFQCGLLAELQPFQQWVVWRAAHDIVLQQQGDISAFNGDASQADFVLVMKLLHWKGDNVELTLRLFLQSGLYREDKTERKTGHTTYLDMTIWNALKKRRNPPMRR
jgi:primase-polymerase (primpol)-like protein